MSEDRHVLAICPTIKAVYMILFSLLTTSLLFGGMMLYSFGFAAFVFSALSHDVARATIRKAFPHFYVFVIVTATVAAGLSWSGDMMSATFLAFIALTTIPARQILMPAINQATDTDAKTRFKWLHGASVLLTLSHIGVTGLVLERFI